MSPILGIYASSISPSLNASSYESIQTITLANSTTNSITFSSIPQTYKHLQLRSFGKFTGSELNVKLQMNSDTGANYAFHFLSGDGQNASAGASFGQQPQFALRLANSNTANVYGANVTDILDYTNTNKTKTVRTLSGWDSNTLGGGQIMEISYLWNSTAAISSLTLFNSIENFVQYSSFSLYGIK